MLRYIFKILLIRDLIRTRYFKPIAIIFAIGLLLAGLAYTYVFFNAIQDRSHASHGHPHSSY